MVKIPIIETLRKINNSDQVISYLLTKGPVQDGHFEVYVDPTQIVRLNNGDFINPVVEARQDGLGKKRIIRENVPWEGVNKEELRLVYKEIGSSELE